MLNTANSCRVYSLILEQNILVAVVLIFSILACYSLLLLSPPTPLSIISSKNTYFPSFSLPPTSTLVPRESVQQVPLEKVGCVLKECLSYTTQQRLSFEELACACSDTSPHTAQTLCRPDSIRASHCRGAEVQLRVAFCHDDPKDHRIIILSVWYQVL